MNKKYILLVLILILFLIPQSNAWWFEKKYTKDIIYSRIDDLTGVLESTQTFKINVTKPVYLKVIGDDESPWMIDGSGWYLDLYLRPNLQSNWTQVATHVHETKPSKKIIVEANTVAELKAVVYYPVVIETTLADDLTPDDDTMICNDTSSFPESGVVTIEDEYIKYNAKHANALSGLTHGYSGSTPSHHPKGTKVEFHSGTYHIPIIIAIDTTSGGGGSGGAMHPSRCHAIDFQIAQGKPPVALFKYTCWYNQLTVNASGSYDPDGRIVSYQWDFDDDGVYDDSGVVAKYTYHTEGYHRVTLKVTDNDGMSSTWSQIIRVKMPPPNSPWLSYTFLGLKVWHWIILIVVACIVIWLKI